MTEQQAERLVKALERIALTLELQDSDGSGLACPACGESDEARLEDTSTMSNVRRTCLSCGKSFDLAPPDEGAT